MLTFVCYLLFAHENKIKAKFIQNFQSAVTCSGFYWKPRRSSTHILDSSFIDGIVPLGKDSLGMINTKIEEACSEAT